MTLKREGTTRVVHFGCEYHDDCDTCPYPDYLECLPSKINRFRKEQEALKLFNEGYSHQEIAEKMGKSTKTIYRYLWEV